MGSHFFLKLFPKPTKALLLSVSVFVMVVLLGNVHVVFAQDVAGRRAALEQELANLEAEIEAQKNSLAQKQKERVSLERDVEILDTKILTAKLSIQARTLSIETLNHDISGKQVIIGDLQLKIEREKESLGELIRKTNEIDSYSMVEVMLSNKNVSDFFQDVDSFNAIKEAVRTSHDKIQTSKIETEAAKENLESKRSEQTQLLTLQQLEKKKIEQEETEKRNIVKATRGLEVEYQKVLKTKEKSAASIRAELFSLRGSQAISFEKALEYANIASKKTGVRPALILGIIAEETNLGENIGTGNWKVDMKAPRDTEPFVAITTSLGFDPDTMPVSKKAWYGYGGAMGPAQFIPSTWVLFSGFSKVSGSWVYSEQDDYIKTLTEKSGPSNPWDPKDAFMAAAVLLRDNGGAKGTPSAERLSALCYLAGCKSATNKAYAFYGDDVMELADKYQHQINILNGN